jgi:hypothetical protein
MTERLVTIAQFSDYIEADLAKQLLEDFGIRAVVVGQNSGNVFSGVPAALDIRLQIPESQAQKAREILENSNEQE